MKKETELHPKITFLIGGIREGGGADDSLYNFVHTLWHIEKQKMKELKMSAAEFECQFGIIFSIALTYALSDPGCT